jgi:protoporphyrin/coproporphyrin ferrochelatase
MRRYLNEFLSDRRVIDYSPWIWQPLLQLIILTKRPFSSGRGLQVDLERGGGREPVDDDHQGADRQDQGHGRSAMATT